jgi:hypothetical protein
MLSGLGVPSVHGLKEGSYGPLGHSNVAVSKVLEKTIICF